MNRENIQLAVGKNDMTVVKTESCSRQLEIYLKSRGIVQMWDDHDYMYLGEVASGTSSSSLESHELISDANSSSEYNLSSVDSTVKYKRNSDSLSALSRSDYGELNCSTIQLNQIRQTNFNTNMLKINLDELERSMDEIMKIKAQCVESVKSIGILTDHDILIEAKEEKDKIKIIEDVEEIYIRDEKILRIHLNFHEAVRMSDTERLLNILSGEFTPDLDEPDWNVSGDPPLLVAATNHSLHVLCILLTAGCDPGVRSPRGETALHRAILNGGPGNVFEFVRELLRYGCSPGVKEAGGGLTGLHILVRQLSYNHYYDITAAHQTLRILAEAGAINDKDHQGRNALHIMASSTIFENINHKEEIESIVNILLAAGADPTLVNDRGETALHEALECNALNTAILLMPHTAIGIVSRYGETPLHIAARKNYIEVVSKLLVNGENPAIQDAGGNTPLHLASARGFYQIVSHIVKSPLVQLEQINDEGLTALQVAAESGFVNTVKLLLKAGADPSIMANCTTLYHHHPDIYTIIEHELTSRHHLPT